MGVHCEYLFDAQTAAQLEALGKLGCTNPFGPERPRLEACIVGEEAARSGPGSRSLHWPIDDPVLPALREEAERQLAEARRALQGGAKADARERDLIRWVALYALYYRYDAAFFSTILD